MLSVVTRQLMCQHCGHKFEITCTGVVACPLCLKDSIIPEPRAVSVASVPSCWEDKEGRQ
jgi:hypothetical protein